MLRRQLVSVARRTALPSAGPARFAPSLVAASSCVRWNTQGTSQAPASSPNTAAPASATGPFVEPIPSQKFKDADITHFRVSSTPHPLYAKKEVPEEWDNHVENTIWTAAEVKGVKETHVPTGDFVDKLALLGVSILRVGFDIVSGYKFGGLTKEKILRRILFLETAAGIPGMVGGSIRHLRSLRLMRRDRGWIHTLLEEAENERMHMMIFQLTYQPGMLFRASVLVTQGIFWNVFFFSYLISPRLCHRFVGYLEEEAVRTYTHILHKMESKDPKYAEIAAWAKSPATELAIRYWRLKPDATMYDAMLAVRADEANHRDVNHTFAGIGARDKCPFEKKGHKH